MLGSSLVSHPARKATAVVALVISSLSAAWSKAAEPTMADVEKLIKRGTDLRRQGKDQEALPAFQKAYDIAATPRTAAQLGLCEMQLGYFLPAEAHLTEALAGRNEWLTKYRAVIEQSLRETQRQIGEVIVSGSPAQAEVIVNGKRAGNLPLGPIRVPAGQVKVELRAPGYADATQAVAVKGQVQERVTIHLRPEGSLEPPRPAPDRALVAHLESTPPSKGASSPPGWGPGKVAGATLVGAGALSIAGGVTLLIVDKHQGCDRQMPGDQCNERTRTHVPGWILLGGGVAAAAVGGVLLFSSSSTQVALGAGPSSVTLSGRF
jgi:hypothetical protein